jgi:hypothetical protein
VSNVDIALEDRFDRGSFLLRHVERDFPTRRGETTAIFLKRASHCQRLQTVHGKYWLLAIRPFSASQIRRHQKYVTALPEATMPETVP